MKKLLFNMRDLNKKDKYYYIGLCLSVIFCMVLVLAFHVNSPLKIANADYSDIINNPNSIVNFNQLAKYTAGSYTTGGLSIDLTDYSFTINAGTSGSSNAADVFAYINLIDGHHYYIDGAFFQIYLNGAFSMSLNNNLDVSSWKQPMIYTATNNYTLHCVCWILANTYYETETYYIKVIDLDQMFGSDNIPSLQDCNDLFISDYYDYTVGQPLAVGNLQGYAQGMADAYASMDITISNYLIGSNCFPFTNNIIRDSNIYYDSHVNYYTFTGVIGIPLYSTVQSGTNFVVDFIVWNTQSGESQSYYTNETLKFGFVDSNNNLITISEIACSSFSNYTNIGYSGSFILPVSTDTIYVWLNYDLVSDPNSDETDDYISVQSDITFRSYNVASMIQSAYGSGFDNASKYYRYGNPGYNDIYQLGYTNGVNAENPYTFDRLMSSVIEAPLSGILSIFNFDFMGWNFKNVITLILTIMLVVAIVRLFMGGN